MMGLQVFSMDIVGLWQGTLLTRLLYGLGCPHVAVFLPMGIVRGYYASRRDGAYIVVLRGS